MNDRPWTEKGKIITSVLATLAALVVVTTGYLQLGGPIPATRQYVIEQIEGVRSRLVDSALQTNKLQLDLLRREQFDRQLQIQQEKNPHVKSIYQDRLNVVGDDINNAITRRGDLEKEKISKEK